ncbi:N-terminal phage integrase SAM-like domain-containing protein [Dehalococcoidia bacterium]|nr:N-terminal phage integrase SAM-like domain-containing protein [Dehalococcoidia bacterium]
MGDYLNEWLKVIKPSLKPKTFDGYNGIVRVHLIPRLGRVALNKLTTEHINNAWANMLKDGHSPSLIDHCHRRLSKALNQAIERKLIVNNPIKFVTKPRVETEEMHPRRRRKKRKRNGVGRKKRKLLT